MVKNELPRFVIYQPNDKEFYICLEVGKVFFRWCSIYPPSLDVRFPREVTRINDLPVKNRPIKRIFDEGTYTITKSDTKDMIREKVMIGVEAKSFSFILNGEKLNGRFAVKSSGSYTILQKFKDKYAKEEDVLSRDLIRTINTMVPDYDESKVKLNHSKKVKKQEVPAEELEKIEEITADKVIGGVTYHFALYTSSDEPDICLITGAGNEVLMLKKAGKQWISLSPVNRTVLKQGTAFSDHATVLFD